MTSLHPSVIPECFDLDPSEEQLLGRAYNCTSSCVAGLRYDALEQLCVGESTGLWNDELEQLCVGLSLQDCGMVN